MIAPDHVFCPRALVDFSGAQRRAWAGLHVHWQSSVMRAGASATDRDRLIAQRTRLHDPVPLGDVVAGAEELNVLGGER
jgi:hypothetical protein